MVEWIPVDCTLGEKPEVLELIELTGQPVEVVVYRMIRLWSWAALNTADGNIRATPRRLAALLGGDERFWAAVETVGWVSFAGDVMTIAGWERRFGSAAKARALKNRRQEKWRRSGDGGAPRDGDAPEAQARLPEETRRDEKRREKPPAEVATSDPPAAAPSRPRPAAAKVLWTAEGGWTGITEADRREWSAAFPGAVLAQELAKATAWLKANPTKAGKRNWKAFVVRWLQRCQDKGGTNREPGARPGEDRVQAAQERWRRVDPVVAEAERLRREKAARLRQERSGEAAPLAAGIAASLKVPPDG